MALATGTKIRAWCKLDESAEDDLLTPHINAARRELKEWVGATNYAAAEAGSEGDEVYDDLLEAEVFLAYSYAVPYLGIRHVPEGFSVQGSLGDEQIKYLGPSDISKLAAEARKRAEKAARAWKTETVFFHLGRSKAHYHGDCNG